MRKIVPNRLRLGLKLPDAIINAPVLRPELQVYFEAFEDLATCRGGMGDGPIPWTAAKCYADHHGLDREDLNDMWFYLSRMDIAWAENKK